jgi:hypothetical protein
MDQRTMMHLGTELVLFCGMFYYTSRSLTELRKEIADLREENQELRDYVDQHRPIGNGVTAQQIQQMIQQALQTQAKDLTEQHTTEIEEVKELFQQERARWEMREQELRVQLAQCDQKIQSFSTTFEKKLKTLKSSPAPQASPFPPQVPQPPPQPPMPPQAAALPTPVKSKPAPTPMPSMTGFPVNGTGFPGALLQHPALAIHLMPNQARASSVIIEEESDEEKSDTEEIEIELEVDEELEKLERELDRDRKSRSKKKSKSKKN